MEILKIWLLTPGSFLRILSWQVSMICSVSAFLIPIWVRAFRSIIGNLGEFRRRELIKFCNNLIQCWKKCSFLWKIWNARQIVACNMRLFLCFVVPNFINVFSFFEFSDFQTMGFFTNFWDISNPISNIYRVIDFLSDKSLLRWLKFAGKWVFLYLIFQRFVKIKAVGALPQPAPVPPRVPHSLQVSLMTSRTFPFNILTNVIESVVLLIGLVKVDITKKLKVVSSQLPSFHNFISLIYSSLQWTYLWFLRNCG